MCTAFYPKDYAAIIAEVILLQKQKQYTKKLQSGEITRCKLAYKAKLDTPWGGKSQVHEKIQNLNRGNFTRIMGNMHWKYWMQS